MGFYITYFSEFDGSLQVEKTYHFVGTEKTGINQSVILSPTWSPDGSFIAFINSIEDGH